MSLKLNRNHKRQMTASCVALLLGLISGAAWAQGSPLPSLERLVPWVVDLAARFAPALLIFAVVMSVAKRQWTSMLLASFLGGAWWLNNENTIGLPVLSAESESLYMTSRAVYLGIATALGVLIMRLLFMGKK